jgi:hypothetical protein
LSHQDFEVARHNLFRSNQDLLYLGSRNAQLFLPLLLTLFGMLCPDDPHGGSNASAGLWLGTIFRWLGDTRWNLEPCAVHSRSKRAFARAVAPNASPEPRRRNADDFAALDPSTFLNGAYSTSVSVSRSAL